MNKIRCWVAERLQALAKAVAPKPSLVLKWDLGDGSEAAIYIRTRREIIDMVNAAKKKPLGEGT